MGAKLAEDLGGGHTGEVALVRREGDRSHAGVASSSVAFADLRQVHHLLRLGLGPGVRADGHLGAETGLAQTDAVGRIGMKKVGDELVYPSNG